MNANCKRIPLALASSMLSLLLLLVAPVELASTSRELRQQCQERTGLSESDIRDIHRRNEGCSIDCTTRQGLVMSLFAKKGTKCADGDTFNCIFEIKILSAHVPDLDSLPMGGPSDAFVVVEANKNADPFYEPNELICHTHVVQDNENPRWNFRCRPHPMRLSSRIKFDVFDSDKPSENHDHIGYATRSVEDLINKGAQKLALNHNGSGDEYYVMVEVTGQEYDSSS